MLSFNKGTRKQKGHKGTTQEPRFTVQTREHPGTPLMNLSLRMQVVLRPTCRVSWGTKGYPLEVYWDYIGLEVIQHRNKDKGYPLHY